VSSLEDPSTRILAPLRVGAEDHAGPADSFDPRRRNRRLADLPWNLRIDVLLLAYEHR